MLRPGLAAALTLVLACSPPAGDHGEGSDTSTSDGSTTTQDVPTEAVDPTATTSDDVPIDCPWNYLVSVVGGDDIPTQGLYSQADVDTFVGRVVVTERHGGAT